MDTILKERIRRNKLEILASDYYVEGDVEVINKLRKEGKKALVGIMNNNGIYTIIGKEFVYYYSTADCNGEISHQLFLEILRENAMKFGKSEDYEFIELKEHCNIWVLNIRTMNAIWNTVQFLITYKLED